MTDEEQIEWMHLREEICDLTLELGLLENKLLLEVAKRLLLGQKEHGLFTEHKIKNGNWTKEALDEEYDNLVYRTLELMQRRMRNE